MIYSVAIAAAFTRDPRFEGCSSDDDDDDAAESAPSLTGLSADEDDYASTSSSISAGSSSGRSGRSSSGGRGPTDAWAPAGLLQWGSALLGGGRRKRLVGFARAAGDYSLVGWQRGLACRAVASWG